jgi:hypothetical protein
MVIEGRISEAQPEGTLYCPDIVIHNRGTGNSPRDLCRWHRESTTTIFGAPSP